MSKDGFLSSKVFSDCDLHAIGHGQALEDACIFPEMAPLR
jgi:hypothetical protein